jgi:hypothetical protein
MTGQFVDLFDKEKYGLNYWAGIMALVGMLVWSVFNAGQTAYNVLVQEMVYYGADQEPLTLGSMLVLSLRWSVSSALGYGIILVASATMVRRDLLLPIVAGLLWVVWGIAIRLVGIVDAPAFDPVALITSFVGILLSLGSIVVLYRVLANKLIGISVGMAFGSVLEMASATIQYGYPLSYYAELLCKQLCLGLIAGVFIFAGIAKHFSTRGMYFGEFGLDAGDGSETAVPATDSTLGKTRRPLVTLLLMIVTLNLYLYGWIYKTYKEVRQRAPDASRTSPGAALGILFIPLVNLFWAAWIYFDLPRAVRRMQRADPPSGHAPAAVLTTVLLVASLVAALAARAWLPAVYLFEFLFWTGVLLVQSSLNSHWLAHRVAPVEVPAP